MGGRVKTVPNTEPLTVRLKPAVRRKLEACADMQGDRVSPHAGKVLEAYAKGMYFCPTCGVPHFIREEDHRS